MEPSKAATTQDDVINLYRLILGREPEAQSAVEANLGSPLAELVGQFYKSEEFDVLARHPVQDGRVTRLSYQVPETKAVAALCHRLDLPEATQADILAAGTHLEMHYRLLKACTQAQYFDYDLSWLEAVDEGRAVPRGEIWGSDAQGIAGWLVPHPQQSQEAAVVEIWHDGVKIAGGPADRFDHRVAALYPARPSSAFWFALPQGHADREIQLEARDASSGVVIGQLRVQQTYFDRGLIGLIEQDLQKMKDQIDKLKSGLPNLSYQTAIPIENYNQFYERWLKQPFDHPLYTDAEVLVLLQAQSIDSIQVEASARAILDQSHPRLRLEIICESGELTLYRDLACRLSLDLGNEVLVTTPDKVPAVGCNAVVVVMSAGAVAHPDLVAASAAYLAASSDQDAVYFDEDCFEDYGLLGANSPRTEPRFKPAFDLDLLLQTPYIGSAIALRAQAWTDLATSGLQLGFEGPSQLALQLDQAGRMIGHWPIVMASWPSVQAAQPHKTEWRHQVVNHLASRAWPARVEDAVDVLGAATSGRGRLVWPVEPGTKASVIIPTRDRLDLLKPCVESLLKHRSDNFTQMEVIIVDHESRDPDTVAYLNNLAKHEGVRILPHEGPFNWALKNNLAAEIATGDVLIFLNNDTLVLSEAWLDELTSQALRPDVGAVGCRLIYPDQTLQHGGFVAAPRLENFLGHEGLFQAGRDGGYLGRYTVVRKTTAVTGACMAVAAERFKALGGFEAAAFPVDGNDVDFCFRARSRGLDILYTPYATLYHFESKTRNVGTGTAGHRAYVSATRRLWEKWGGLYGSDPYYNPNFDRTMMPFSRLNYASRLL